MLDWAWLAGLLEGEGNFTPAHRGKGFTPRVRLVMTDRDVVERAAQMMRPTNAEVKRRAPSSDGHKEAFHFEVSGEGAETVMVGILPYLGSRRANAVTSVLAAWYTNRERTCPICNADFYAGAKEGSRVYCAPDCYRVSQTRGRHRRAQDRKDVS